jgi:hypothetical protein
MGGENRHTSLKMTETDRPEDQWWMGHAEPSICAGHSMLCSYECGSQLLVTSKRDYSLCVPALRKKQKRPPKKRGGRYKGNAKDAGHSAPFRCQGKQNDGNG